MNIFLPFFKEFSSITRFISSLIIRSLILIGLFFILNTSACNKENVGKCTISIYGGEEEVYEDISIEECQNIFGNTPGGIGWEWDPGR